MTRQKTTQQPKVEIDGAVQALQQMSPGNQDIIVKMIETLAERDGINIGTIGSTGLKSLEDGIDLWETMLQQERYSPRTIDLYRGLLTNFLKQDPNPTSLSIRTYLANRLKEKSSSIVASDRKAFRSFFGFLHQEGLWHSNPMTSVKSIAVTYGKRECPEPETVMAILKASPTHKNHIMKFRMMTVLLVGTALRITEAASITRSNIDIRNLEITVMGKGRKERTVPIDGLVAGMLEQYTQKNPTKTQYLFPAEIGDSFWNIHSYEKTLGRICKRNKLPHTTPHQLRHFYATYALQKGAKIEVISRILGHASVAITLDIYRHVNKKEIHETHDTFSPLSQMQKQLPQQGTKTQEEVIEADFVEVEEGK